MSLATPEKIRKLQRALYVKAKHEPTRRFHFLYDKVWREDILTHAYARCRSNGGAPGVDGETFTHIEGYGVDRWLNTVREEVRTGRYRPQPVKRVMIPKSGGVGQRPLGIPTIRDRVVQTAAKLVLEPIFEADFDGAAYGYRPKRSALDAVRTVHRAIDEGHTKIVDADLSKYFDTIPHPELIKCVARRVSDGKMLHLIKMWLKTPVEETGERGHRRMSGGKKATRGTPQGGVASPLLANIYMHRFIKAFRKHGLDRRYDAVLVTYADDFVVLCRHGAGEVLETTRRWMASIGLTLNETKTRVCDARCEPFDFLGYTFGPMYSPRTGGRYNGARPSKKAVASVKEHIRRRLRSGNHAPWEDVARGLNRMVRGWSAYFSYGSVTQARHGVKLYLYHAVRRFLRRRHKVAGSGYRRFPDFLGYTFGPMYSPRTGGRYNGARPSKKAVASVKEHIRRRLRSGNHAPWEDVARGLNRTVRGWSAYFSYGSVTQARHGVKLYLYHAVRRFLRRRHKVAGSGYRRFPTDEVFGKLGVLSPESCPHEVWSAMRTP